jgi:uncharacterized membrane protein
MATAAMLIATILWVSFTPGGLLGRADAIGYAVCHRIAARSFVFPNGRVLPMCARCSGTFLGVLLGLLVPGLVFKQRRAGLFPPLGVMAVMIGMSAFWAFDGANSFSHLLPENSLPRLYQPSNFLRLFTGMFHGITLSSLLLPIANATLWADVTHERTIKNAWQLLALWGIGGILIVMVLTGWGIFLYPLAVLSAVGVVSVLTVINSIMVATILKQENAATSLREVLPVFFFGIAITFIMIGVIDAGRFALFGTWDGFVFPNP